MEAIPLDNGVLRDLRWGQGKELRPLYHSGLWDLHPSPMYARPSRAERGNVATSIAAGLIGRVGLNEVAAGILRRFGASQLPPSAARPVLPGRRSEG